MAEFRRANFILNGIYIYASGERPAGPISAFGGPADQAVSYVRLAVGRAQPQLRPAVSRALAGTQAQVVGGAW